ncbi:MAG: sulfotransferase [Gammaproteobacteria bacterium]|nr:sulfotransferase [Gammaproteobacteria bacterium]
MSSSAFPGVEQLLEQAAAACGLDDFGSDYEEGLEVLVESIRTDVRPIHAGNVPQLSGPLLGLLVSRARSQEGWKKRPDCLRQPLRAPLVVTGIPRTGTTALHKLLSMDSQFQGLEQWLIGSPMPRPTRASWEDNPLFLAAVAQQEAFLDAVPAMRASHEVNADEVDECLNLLAQSFVSHYPATGIGLPTYDRWWWGRDETPSYRRYADNLRLIGADSPDQRWLLKNPGHITHLDALLTVFPDACIIQTHRDPAACIPSLCGVIWPARCFFHGREVDAHEVGPRELEFWAWSAERAEQVRRRQPERFFDVRFADFQRQPMAVVDAIFRHFSLELSPQAEQQMKQWLAANPRHKHGRHEYSAEQYGLSTSGIHERFAGYMAQHQL